MRERVYRPGRGPRQHIGVKFGVSQAARTAKSQVNNRVLQWKLRWSLVPLVFSTANGYRKGGWTCETGSTGLEGVQGSILVLNSGSARLLD